MGGIDDRKAERQEPTTATQLAVGVLGFIGLMIGIGLFSTGSAWLSDGSHGQAGWLLRLGGIAVFGGSVLLATRWQPRRRVRWPQVVLVAACIGTIALGLRLHSLTGADHEPVVHEGSAWVTRDGSRAASPTEYDLFIVGSWILMFGGAAGVGVLALNEVRRKDRQARNGV